MSEWLPATSLGFHAAPSEPPVVRTTPPRPPPPSAPPLPTSALGCTTDAQRTPRRDAESSRKIWTLGVVAAISVLLGIGVGWAARSMTMSTDEVRQIAHTTSGTSHNPVVSGPPVTSAGDARPVDRSPSVPSPLMPSPPQANGFAQFDSQAGRITSAQERFVVRGQVNAELLGQVAPIELEESQTLTIAVTDQNPWK